jgi:quinol monooxygenase YgiN
MDELFVVVGLRAKPGKEEQLKRNLSAVVEPSRQEPGCLRYELFEDRSDPALFVFVEHWASLEAQNEHHTKGPHIQPFQADGAADVERFEFLHMLRRIA